MSCFSRWCLAQTSYSQRALYDEEAPIFPSDICRSSFSAAYNSGFVACDGVGGATCPALPHAGAVTAAMGYLFANVKAQDLYPGGRQCECFVSLFTVFTIWRVLRLFCQVNFRGML